MKTRLQVQGNLATSRYRGSVLSLAQTIFREEGIRGFFTGLTPTLFGFVPTWVIYFGTYAKAKTFYQEKGFEGTPNHIVSALTAGIVTDICTNGIWVIKTRMQVLRPHEKPYKNILDAAKRLYVEEGIKGFYKGLVPQLLGLVHVAIQFPLYERFKGYLLPPEPSKLSHIDDREKRFSSTLPTSSSPLSSVENNTVSSLVTPPSSRVPRLMLSAICSKGIASIIAYPHEVLRSRMQFQSRTDANFHDSLTETIRSIYTREGVRGFYRGLSVNLMRVLPATAVSLTTYELVSAALLGH